MRYASAVICLLIGGVFGFVLNDATRPLPEYAQDRVCRSVCESCGECLSHRGIKLRVDRPPRRQSGKPSRVMIDDIGLLDEPGPTIVCRKEAVDGEPEECKSAREKLRQEASP